MRDSVNTGQQPGLLGGERLSVVSAGIKARVNADGEQYRLEERIEAERKYQEGLDPSQIARVKAELISHHQQIFETREETWREGWKLAEALPKDAPAIDSLRAMGDATFDFEMTSSMSTDNPSEHHARLSAAREFQGWAERRGYQAELVTLPIDAESEMEIESAKVEITGRINK